MARYPSSCAPLPKPAICAVSAKCLKGRDGSAASDGRARGGGYEPRPDVNHLRTLTVSPPLGGGAVRQCQVSNKIQQTATFAACGRWPHRISIGDSASPLR